MTGSIPGTEFPTATCTVCGHFHARREDGRILPSVDHEPSHERTCSDCGYCRVPGIVNVETFENLDARFMQHQTSHRLRQRKTLRVPTDGMGPEENAWRIANREGRDVDGEEWPHDVRSMSVGDVIHIIESGEWFAVDSLGFKSIGRPPESSLTYSLDVLLNGPAGSAAFTFEPEPPRCVRCGDLVDGDPLGRICETCLDNS